MISGIRYKEVCLLVVLAVAGLFGSASAQKIEGYDTGLGGSNMITGTVFTATGQRVETHISVRLQTMSRGDRVTVTNDMGNFAFLGLPNGDYTIVIDKEKDFEPLRQSMNVFQMTGTPGQTFTLSLRLKSKAEATKPAVVNAELSNVPPAAMVFYNKAIDLAKTGDHKGAIEQLELAIKEHPQFAAAYNDMGVHYLQSNDLVKADEAFKSALGINKTSFAPMLNHGMTLYNLKLYADAEPVLRDVIKAKDDSAAGHFFLGQSLAYQGKFVGAVKELTNALTLGGDKMADSLKEAHRLLAIIYSTQGNKKQQADELEIYLKLAPNSPDAEALRQLVVKLRG